MKDEKHTNRKKNKGEVNKSEGRQRREGQIPLKGLFPTKQMGKDSHSTPEWEGRF